MKVNVFVRLKESFASKTIPQKIRICIGLTLVLTFVFFVIKGTFFDERSAVPSQETSQISQSAESGGESGSPQEETSTQSSGKVHFNISWLDIGILAALLTAYGVHKYREKKREKRL